MIIETSAYQNPDDSGIVWGNILDFNAPCDIDDEDDDYGDYEDYDYSDFVNDGCDVTEDRDSAEIRFKYASFIALAQIGRSTKQISTEQFADACESIDDSVELTDEDFIELGRDYDSVLKSYCTEIWALETDRERHNNILATMLVFWSNGNKDVMDSFYAKTTYFSDTKENLDLAIAAVLMSPHATARHGYKLWKKLRDIEKDDPFEEEISPDDHLPAEKQEMEIPPATPLYIATHEKAEDVPMTVMSAALLPQTKPKREEAPATIESTVPLLLSVPKPTTAPTSAMSAAIVSQPAPKPVEVPTKLSTVIAKVPTLQSDTVTSEDNSPVAAIAIGYNVGWLPPAKLVNMNHPVFPLYAFPPEVRDYIEAVAEFTQTPVDMAATAVLGTFAGANQKKFVVQADWMERLSLYVFIIADSGERKTSVLDYARSPFELFQDGINQCLKNDIIDYELKKEHLKFELKQLTDQWHKQKNGVTQDMVKQKRLELENLKPIKKVRLTIGDTTPEKLAILLSENDERLFVVSDEGGLINSLTGKRYSNQTNLDLLLQAYSGAKHEQDRVSGNRSIELHNPALTLLIMGQHTILDELIINAELARRGFIARSLFCAPPTRMGGRLQSGPPVPANIECAYRSLIMELLAIPVPQVPLPILPDQAAYNLFTHFGKDLETNRLMSELAYMKDWGARYPGTILRIAGNLHTMQHGSNSANVTISESTMRNAIAVGEYFLAYAKWAYTKTGANTDITRAKGVLNRLQAYRSARISLRDLRRLCPGRNSFASKDDFDPVLELLVDHGYLKAVGTAQKTGRPSMQYEINPYLYTNTFSAVSLQPDEDNDITLDKELPV